LFFFWLWRAMPGSFRQGLIDGVRGGWWNRYC
jgi:hypothetical protein